MLAENETDMTVNNLAHWQYWWYTRARTRDNDEQKTNMDQVSDQNDNLLLMEVIEQLVDSNNTSPT